MIILPRSRVSSPNCYAAILCAAVVLLASSSARAAYPIRLDGLWQFELDPNDVGVNQEWFNRSLKGRIRLPGILQWSSDRTQMQYGSPIRVDTPWVLSLYDRYWYLRDDYKADVEPGRVKVPFLSQPPSHYLGAAWYQLDFFIPQQTNTRRTLTLERPHWQTTVWVDSRLIGSQESLVAPHVYDLGTMTPGRHRLTIRVDNRMIMPYRPDAHSVSDSLGATWNGIVGKIQFEDTGRVWIDDAQAFPNLTERKLRIKVHIGNVTGRSGQATLTAIGPDVAVVPASWDQDGGDAEIEVPIRDDAPIWDEFHPKRLSLRLWLKGADVDEYKDLTVGLRDFHAEGNQFILNGNPINFRGTHHGGDFPLTGYPPTDVNSWKTLFELCKKWGLNHMRFHSWCPPEAAFEAADQVGFYLQPEPGMWNEISPGTPMEKMLYEETDRMIKAYGNHPSFMLLSASNEPKGKWQESLSKWVEHYHNEDPRRLYASGTGHTERELENISQGTDYLDIQRINQMMLRRESGWFGNDFGQSLTDVNVPVIAHEVGQWAAYPDYDVIKKFKGYLRPGNYEIFRDSMEAHGLLAMDKPFAEASSRFQFECYKEEIEANLRTPGLGGFQLLDLHDYLGQGTALIGLLDAFWDPKGSVTANEFTEFCNTTVPLARLTSRVFTTADKFNADVELAHFGAEPMKDAKAVWRIEGPPNKPLLAQGEWEVRTFPIGKNIPLGKISADLSLLEAPVQETLVVTVAPLSMFDPSTGKIRAGAVKGTDYFENHWKFWVYPTEVPAEFHGSSLCPVTRPPNILVTHSWIEAQERLDGGGKVLFVPDMSELDWTNPPLDTVPVFWNRQMGPGWGRMLGLLIGGVGDFPTEPYFDWQWSSLMTNVRAINLDHFPKEIKPTVWAIDDWNRNYKLGVIFECAVGKGKLLVSAIDVTKPNDRNVVRRQLRYALLNYMASDCFNPQIFVQPGTVSSLFFDTRIMKELGATAQIDGQPAAAAIDGDPNTYVLAGDPRADIREPVELTITFPSPVTMSGIIIMPRQNHREHEGDIRQYSLQVSDNASDWHEVRHGELLSTYAPQRLDFTELITTKYLKLISLAGFGDDKRTALAELAVIYRGGKLNDSDSGVIEYQRNRSATPDIDEGPGAIKRPSPSPTATRRP